MDCAPVGYKPRSRIDIGFTSPDFRNPYNIRAQTRVGIVLQDFVFYFGGPPKTDASGRRDEHYDTNFSTIRIECIAQVTRIIADDCVRRYGPG